MKDQTAAAKRKPYDSDLTDAQWSVIDPLLPPPGRRGRPSMPTSERGSPTER